MVTTDATGQKTILVVTTGVETPREIELDLAPGTLVADALTKSGLTGWTFQNPSGGTYQPATNLYDAVEHGQKLFAARIDGLSAG